MENVYLSLDRTDCLNGIKKPTEATVKYLANNKVGSSVLKVALLLVPALEWLSLKLRFSVSTKNI